MRLMYHVDSPQEVLKVLKNPDTVAVFDQFVSYQIGMDLLLKHKMYEEVLEVFDICLSRNIKGGSEMPRNPVVLAFCAAYNMVMMAFRIGNSLSLSNDSYLFSEHPRIVQPNARNP